MLHLEEQISALCEKLKVPEPINFLTRIMAGQDPRCMSEVLELALELEEKYPVGQIPDDWDYRELIELIKSRYTFKPVTIKESQDAAKQVLEYTHPKRKQIDHSGNIGNAPDVTSLTEEEVELFKAKFDELF